MMPPGFVPLKDIIKQHLDRQTNPHAKLTSEGLENAIFDHLQKTQLLSLQTLPFSSETLKAQYVKEVQESGLALKQKNVFKQVLNEAFNRFGLFAAIRNSLITGLPLKLQADRLNSLRRAYFLKRKKNAKEEFEDFKKEWEEFNRLEDKLDEEEYEAWQKRLEEDEAEEKQAHRGFMDIEVLAGPILPLSENSLNDPKIIEDNLRNNVSALNTVLQSALQKIGIDLKSPSEDIPSLNDPNASSFEKQLNDDPNRLIEPNDPFNLAFTNLQQNYQTMQAAIPPANTAAQHVLQQWATQVGQNLTQWAVTGQVQPLDANFKNALENVPQPQQNRTSTPNNPIKNNAFESPTLLQTTSQAIQNDMQKQAQNLKQETEPEQTKTPNRSTSFDWPPKPRHP